MTGAVSPGKSMKVIDSGKTVGAYLKLSRRVWNHLPDSWRARFLGRAYGRHLHSLVCRHAERKQNHSTFFLRNRAELELLRRIVGRKPGRTELDLTILACSKGAEVYSFAWAIRSTYPDLKLNLHAIDISQEIVDFARRGIYSRRSPDPAQLQNSDLAGGNRDATWQDQVWSHHFASMFERMTDKELEEMFELDADLARIRPWLREGITWMQGDANDSQLAAQLGPQEIVVANRFLCHMRPPAAERCLRSIAGLVKRGGYLFVSGVDAEVKAKVAQEMDWNPVTEMMREVQEADISLTKAWPLDYWGVEPFCDDLPDWKLRCASVFQIG